MYWRERYNKLVGKATEVWIRHIELVKAVRVAMPDYDLFREY
jgi:hypothetical protein